MDKPFPYYILRLREQFARYSDDRLAEMGLTRGLMFFLIYVGKQPGCSPSALSAALRADTGHTTRSLDKLVRAGLLARERRAEDRRGFSLRLTEAGEAALAHIEGLFDQWEALALEALPLQQRADLTGALADILAHLEQLEGEVHG